MSGEPFRALVLCEGKEDRLVFEKIAVRAGLQGLRFEDYNGKDSLPIFLKGLKVRPEFTRREFKTLALTRDADDSYPAAWQSLAGTAQSAFGVTLPSPGQKIEVRDQAYAQDPSIELTGWVLPGPDQVGMLETLCLESVSGAPEFQCLTAYFDCLSQATRTADYHPKAKFHAWVVSHTDFKDKDYKIEKAVKEDKFNWDHRAFDGLRDFLRNLVV